MASTNYIPKLYFGCFEGTRFFFKYFLLIRPQNESKLSICFGLRGSLKNFTCLGSRMCFWRFQKFYVFFLAWKGRPPKKTRSRLYCNLIWNSLKFLKFSGISFLYISDSLPLPHNCSFVLKYSGGSWHNKTHKTYTLTEICVIFATVNWSSWSDNNLEQKKIEKEWKMNWNWRNWLERHNNWLPFSFFCSLFLQLFPEKRLCGFKRKFKNCFALLPFLRDHENTSQFFEKEVFVLLCIRVLGLNFYRDNKASTGRHTYLPTVYFSKYYFF